MYIYYYVLVKREKTFCYDNRSFVVFFVQNWKDNILVVDDGVFKPEPAAEGP